MNKHQIRCGYCGVMKAYPDEFPNSMYVKCFDCYEEERVEREARRQAWKHPISTLWVWITIRYFYVKIYVMHFINWLGGKHV